MPSEPKETSAATVTRPLRNALLKKQPEIEEVDEEDTSPSSDQSDSTITAGECFRPIRSMLAVNKVNQSDSNLT